MHWVELNNNVLRKLLKSKDLKIHNCTTYIIRIGNHTLFIAFCITDDTNSIHLA